MTSDIPTSPALAEAQPDSLSELMARDPESYQQQDLDRIIASLRERRVQWEAAEQSRPARAKKVATPLSTKIVGSTIEDLGL